MNRPLTLIACVAIAIVTRTVRAAERLHDFHVLSIGLTDYRKNPGQELTTAVPDAKALTDFFLDQNHLGEKESQRRVRPLYNAAATKKAIERQLADLPNWVAERSTLVISYIGHGERFAGRWLLLPYDVDVDRIEETSVSGETIMQAVDAVIAKKHCRVVVILNSCHSGAILDAAEPVLAKYRNPADGGLILMAACAPGEVSYFSRFGGVFTSSLLVGLKGAAHVEATNSVNLREIGRYLRSNIQERLHSEARKAPGLEWPEQDLMIEHSQSISDDIGMATADPRHLATAPIGNHGAAIALSKYCTVIQTKNSPVGLWRCIRPIVLKRPAPSIFLATTYLRMTGKDAKFVDTRPLVLVDGNGDPVVEVIALQLFADGHYEVAFRSASGKMESGAGRYRFRPGKEFSLNYSNGTDYFSLEQLDSKQLILRIGSSLGFDPLQMSPEFVFERIDEKSK